MPAFGIDFNSGKRDASADQYYAAKKFVENYENNRKYGLDDFGKPLPFESFQIPGITSNLTPTDLNADSYIKLQKELFPLRMQETAKENLLNVGSGLVFGAASIPFMEFQRNKELERQMEAFRMKEQSQTAQTARNVAAQQMATGAAEATAGKRNAFANLMRAAVEPLRTRR